MSDMFNYLEAQAREENLPFRNAAAVAIDRAERRFGSFVESAQGDKEFNARLALVAEEIVKIANETCEEYGYDDPQHVAKLVIGQLQILAEAKPETGGEADEKQKLPTMPTDGYYTEPTVALNPNSAGDNMKNTNPDIPELAPDESQHPKDKEWPWDSPIPMEGDGLERTNVSDQKPEQKGPKTQTFPNKGQADPVTSKTAAEPNWNNSDMDEDAAWDDSDEYEDVPLVGYNSEDDLEDPALYELQEEMDAPYSDMSPMYQSERLKKWEGPVDSDKSGLHGDNGGAGSLWSDRKNWKNYRDQQYKPTMAKAAAERMDFNALSELMSPSEAVENLVSAGMPQHEAKDRIDFYVNHVDPGWAHKSWTAGNRDIYEQLLEMDEPSEEELTAMPTQDVMSMEEIFDEAAKDEADTAPQEDDQTPVGDLYAEDVNDDFLNPTSSTKESIWDTSDPELLDMSYEVGDIDPDQIAQVYRQYANSGRFETSQQAVDTLFAMYAENRPDAVDQIAQAFEEAIGLAPSNVEDVRQHANRFAKKVISDIPVSGDQVNRLKNLLRNPELKSWERQELKRLLKEAEETLAQERENRDLEAGVLPEQKTQTMDDFPLEDSSTPSVKTSPTINMPVKYKMMASTIYQSFLKKQAKK